MHKSRCKNLYNNSPVVLFKNRKQYAILSIQRDILVKEMKPMDQLGSILNTIMEALSSFLPMDEITGALQPVLDTIMKLLEPIIGSLMG